ncbi:MAG: long-chain acyl-[acyl-carrier-protein] reductase, partial [Cyanobacteriota bacterium]
HRKLHFNNHLERQIIYIADMANPRRQLFACFAEAMLLEFEGIHTNFSWGRNNIDLEKMELIGAASLRHGFQALGLETSPAPSLATA